MYIDGHNVRCKKEERENESFFLLKKIKFQWFYPTQNRSSYVLYCDSYCGFYLKKIYIWLKL